MSAGRVLESSSALGKNQSTGASWPAKNGASFNIIKNLLCFTLGSPRCNRVKSKNGRCRFARPAAAVAARLRSTASAASRCCPTHPSCHPPGISSLPVRRLRIFGPGVVLSNLHLRHIIFDCYDRSASPGAGYGLLCSCAQRLFLPPRSSRANRSCRPPSPSAPLS